MRIYTHRNKNRLKRRFSLPNAKVTTELKVISITKFNRSQLNVVRSDVNCDVSTAYCESFRKGKRKQLKTADKASLLKYPK